jgi:hypothetical protein
VKSPMFKNMMGDQAEDIEKMMEDPAMVNQMAGFWKHLDEMQSSDEKGYKEFIEKQKKEFEQENEKIKKEKEKKRLIQPNLLCCIKILPAKIIVKN